MRCVLPRLIAILGLTLFVLGPTCGSAAQREPDRFGADIPAPATMMQAYSAVEAAVRAWAAPSGPLTAREDSPVGAVWGARVTLRLHGKPFGTGTRTVAPGSSAPDPNLLPQACAEAIAAADRRLPLSNDLRRLDAAKALAADMQISLELASRPTPVVGDGWSEIDAQLNPGLDGLIVRLAHPAEGAPDPLVKFPSDLMAQAITPQKALRSMIADVIGEGGAAAVLMRPAEIRAKHGVVIERFRVAHVAQCAPRASAQFLFRGSSLRADSPLTSGEIRSMADALATNLMRRWTDAQTRRPNFTSYLATEDRFTGNEDSPHSLLLAAIALNRYNSLVLTSAQQRSVDEALTRLQQACPLPESGVEWSMQAMVQWPPSQQGLSLTGTRAKAAIELSASEAATGQTTDTTGWDEQALERYRATRFATQDPPAQALMLSAMARSARGDSASLRTCLGRLLAATRPEQLVGLMPWAGWAAVDAAAAEDGKKADIAAAVALRQMRSLCWKHQLSTTDVGDDAPDMVGGIVFTSGTSTPLPTWQSLRPLAFVAAMLGDDRLTEPSERPLELARLLQSLRFLRQLQVDESCGWLYPQPAVAMGGVRAATWDHSMPPDATSLALLTVCETLHSLEAMAAAGAAQLPARAIPSSTPTNTAEPPQNGP